MSAQTLTIFVFTCDMPDCTGQPTSSLADRPAAELQLPRGERAGGHGTAMSPGVLIESRADADRYARQQGWTLGKTVRCPQCAAAVAP